MQSHTSYVGTTYGEKTSFDQFLDAEGIPVVRNFVVGDVRRLAVSPWRRRGGLGCYIIFGHPKDPLKAPAYVCEIPPGRQVNPPKQMLEERIYALKGEGASSGWRDNAKK